MKYLKVDYYLFLIFLLILIVFKIPGYAFIVILPILCISYYRIIVKGDITITIILMLSTRLIMGPFVIHNHYSFNLLNAICNYIPLLIILLYNFYNLKTVNIKKLMSLKWTIVFLIFLLLFSFLHLSYAITVFPKEILPLLLFLLVVISNSENQINYNYLLKFFRYSFLACLLIYVSPHFLNQMHYLLSEGVIFKEHIDNIALTVNRIIPRNVGFVFDFRIMGQLACLYLILLYYLNKAKSYWDVALLFTIAILTFSRGPLIILAFLLMAVYLPKKIRITKKLLLITIALFVLSISTMIYVMNDEHLYKFVNTFNPLTEKNAFSQRAMFSKYAFNKFCEHPLGNGIGSLSSPKANNKIYAGLTNLHKAIPDKVYYYTVTDAYLAMSLAEKGIIGFTLLILSLVEIFYLNKNRISLFFFLGLMINLIGTDIPKQGFYYFVLITVYYSLSQNKSLNTNKLKSST